jgi:hypothetical protein
MAARRRSERDNLHDERKGENFDSRLFLCEDFLPPPIRNFSFMLTNQPAGIINSDAVLKLAIHPFYG